MADKIECLKNMNVHFQRIWYSITHPFSDNPYSKTDRDKMRKGWNDILFLHAFVNLFVEFCRACPYYAGHLFFFENLIFLIFVLFLLF